MHKSIVADFINNIWSFAGWGAGTLNAMTLQLFFNLEELSRADGIPPC